MLSLVRRLRDLIPLTASGALVLASGVAVHLFWGQGAADHVLYAAGPTAGALVLLSLALVVAATCLAALRLRDTSAGVRAELEVGVPTRTDLTSPGIQHWPLVSLRIDWVSPSQVDVELKRGEELATPRRRGAYDGIVRRVTIEDVFGFASLSFQVQHEQALRILPAPGSAQIHVPPQRVSGDAVSHPEGEPIGDLVEMRRYAHGDSLRHVLWKTYARTRRLLVRTPERAMSPQPSAAGYLVSGTDDELAASTARAFVDHGLLGERWLFSADGAGSATSHAADALDRIVLSANAQLAPGDGLGAFVTTCEQRRFGSCYVFASPVRGPWCDQIGAVAKRGGTAFTVVLTVASGVRQHVAPTGWARFLWDAAPSVGSDPVGRVQALRRELGGMGIAVEVIEGGSGRSLNHALSKADK